MYSFEENYVQSGEFVTDQVFMSLDDLKEWAQNIARNNGYVLVTQRSKKTADGFINKVFLRCDRGGVYKGVSEVSVSEVRKSGTKKSNCPFQLILKHHVEQNCWTVTLSCGLHNHPPSHYMEGHSYAQRLSEKEKILVADMTKQNFEPRDILLAIRGANPNSACTIKNIYNERQRQRIYAHGDRSPMQVLFSLIHQLGYYQEHQKNKSTLMLERLFIVHPKSFEIWRAFPHVLLIDATYKTNRYEMPFVEIVGLTSTGKNFCVAFAFISNEREDSYTWVLNQVKTVLDKCMQPRVIVSDREQALMNACQRVFPDATRLLCRFHISQNISKHHKKSFKNEGYWIVFCNEWKTLVNSRTEEIYNYNCNRLEEKYYSSHPKLFPYLYTTWLKTYKEMFVSVWCDQSLNLGTHTTNRVEGQHAVFKRHMNSSNSTLEKFPIIIDRLVELELTCIKGTLTQSQIVTMHHLNQRLLSLLLNKISKKALELIIEESSRLNDLHDGPCGCLMRSGWGLPCACLINDCMLKGVPIPLESINVFWMKLDLGPSVAQAGDDISIDAELDTLKQHFNLLPKIQKKGWVSKLRAIWNPSETDVQPPARQTNTRGRPNLNSNQKKKHDVGRTSEFVNSDEAPRHSSYANTEDINQSYGTGRHSSYMGGPNLFGHYEDMGAGSSFDFPVNLGSYDDSMFNYGSIPEYDFIGLSQHSTFNHSSAPEYDFKTPHTFCENISKDEIEYIHQIPEIFQKHVKRTHNVLGDGNCGFRAVAYALGFGEDKWLWMRNQLIEELVQFKDKYNYHFFGAFDSIYESLNWSGVGIAPRKHWMLMPETGFLIANKFGVVVHFLSCGNSSTCFPLWSGPHKFPQHKVITIAFVNGNHFITVELQGYYPMANTNNLWTLTKSSTATGWETLYHEQQQEYINSINKPSSSFVNLT